MILNVEILSITTTLLYFSLKKIVNLIKSFFYKSFHVRYYYET